MLPCMLLPPLWVFDENSKKAKTRLKSPRCDFVKGAIVEFDDAIDTAWPASALLYNRFRAYTLETRTRDTHTDTDTDTQTHTGTIGGQRGGCANDHIT